MAHTERLHLRELGLPFDIEGGFGHDRSGVALLLVISSWSLNLAQVIATEASGLGEVVHSLVGCLKEVLDNLMVLLQELLHLEDQVVRVFLSFTELISQSIDFLVEARLYLIKVNVVALLVLLDRNLKISSI